MARDYRKERRDDYGYRPASSVTPEQRRHRREMAARKQARARMVKEGKVSKGDGKEVDHKDGNPRTTHAVTYESRRAEPTGPRDDVGSASFTLPHLRSKISCAVSTLRSSHLANARAHLS